MNYEQQTMSMWHNYQSLGGSADFETFYAHSIDNQKLLVKVAIGKAKPGMVKPDPLRHSEIGEPENR